MTNHPEIFAALAAPFRPSEVKQRAGGGGRAVSYITSRTVANRLDDVLGPENWWFEPASWGDHSSALGRLTIRLPDGSTVTKSDVGGAAGMSDSGDDDKSAVSDALKRAAQLFGVGRYLYGDGVPRYGVAGEPDDHRPTITIDRDALPSQARSPSVPQVQSAPGSGRPQRDRSTRRVVVEPDGTRRFRGPGSGRPPHDGRTLYAWVKDRQERDEAPYLRDLQAWATDCGYPSRLLDWSAEQVAQGLIEAERLVDAHRAACQRQPAAV